MGYIKLYENFNEPSYELVDSSKFTEFCHTHTKLDISDVDFAKISDVLDRNRVRFFTERDMEAGPPESDFLISIPDRLTSIRVFKYDDEWWAIYTAVRSKRNDFVTSLNRRYYICDGIDSALYVIENHVS